MPARLLFASFSMYFEVCGTDLKPQNKRTLLLHCIQQTQCYCTAISEYLTFFFLFNRKLMSQDQMGKKPTPSFQETEQIFSLS